MDVANVPGAVVGKVEVAVVITFPLIVTVYEVFTNTPLAFSIETVYVPFGTLAGTEKVRFVPSGLERLLIVYEP